MKTSAPGKLFLIGEYAVLEGAPAILTPVPQRAEVTLLPSEGRPHSGTVITRDHETRRLATSDALKSLPLLRAVVETLDCFDAIAHKELTLDTAAFFSRGIKLGLGSSAALTAALVKLVSADQNLSDTQLVKLAQQCHHRFQDGRGSGADIALSMSDGCIVHQGGSQPSRITLPDQLRMLAIWTGEAASTTGYLKAMEQWRARHESIYQQHIQQLTDTASQAVHAVHAVDAGQLLTCIARYDTQLEQLSRDSALNFYNQTHLEMRKRVELADCTYKPSGAGGGDFGIAYYLDQSGYNGANNGADNGANTNKLNQLAEELEHEGVHCIFLDAVTTPFQE